MPDRTEDPPLTAKRESEPPLRDIYFFVATADVAGVRARVATARRGSVTALILNAVLAQYAGGVERAMQLFERALAESGGDGRAYVVDLVAPILVMREDWDRYSELRASVRSDSELESCFLAFDAVALARSGSAAASERTAMRAEAILEPQAAEFVRARVLQRVAHAAYERAGYDSAMEKALESAHVFEAIGAGRSAAASYSIVYNILHAVSGDLEGADLYAHKIVDAAQRSGDQSFMMSGLVAQYEIASELSDISRSQSLRKQISSLALPKQYQERFARGIADVLVFAAGGDFAAFRANIVLLRDSVVCDRSMIALTSALRSLAEAGLEEFDEARRSSRNALGLCTIRDAGEPAYAKRYRRIARAIAACTCLLIQDSVRARRAANNDADCVALMAVAEGADYHNVQPRMRGYARAVAAAYVVVARSHHRSPLSPGEFEVLRLLAEGYSAPQIAASSNRSVHTVRAHTRSIIEKFGVSGRAAAVAFARRSGLLIHS